MKLTFYDFPCRSPHMGRKRGVDTQERARPLTSRSVLVWFPKSFGRLLRKLAHVKEHAANTSRDYFRKEESGNRNEREHAEAFVMRCKAVAVDREPDRCGNSVWVCF